MKKSILIIILLLLSLTIGCNNKNNKAYLFEIIEEYRYSDNISIKIKTLNNEELIFNNSIVCQPFLELFYNDIQVIKHNYSYNYSNKKSTVEIKAENEKSNLIINIYENGSIYLDDGEYKYTGRKDTINFELFNSFSNVEDIRINSIYKQVNYIEDINTASYLGRNCYTLNNNLLDYQLIEKDYDLKDLQTIVKKYKNENLSPGDNYEFLFAKVKLYTDKILNLQFYNAVDSLLKEFKIIKVPSNYFGEQKAEIEYYIAHHNYDFCISESDPTNSENSISLYGVNGAGIIYDSINDEYYAICESDINEIDNKIKDAKKLLDEKEEELKDLIIEWWNE